MSLLSPTDKQAEHDSSTGSAASRRTVGASLRRAAERWPDELALRFGDERVSFRELERHCARMLAALQSAGLGKGDRVLMMLANDLTYVYAALGSGSGGIIEVPVNSEYRGEMLRYIVRHSGARTMLIDAAYLDRLLQVDEGDLELDQVFVSGGDGADLPLRYHRLEELVAGAHDPVVPEVAETDPVAVMYTSGTTGPSKGALIAHRHAFEYARAAGELTEVTDQDTYYAPLPLFHIAGQWAVLYAALQRGATVFLKQRFSVGDFWTDVRDGGVTVSFLLGAMAQWLHAQPPRPDDADQPLERVLMVPLIDDLDAFRERFDLRVATCYGSTEVNLPILAGFETDDPKVCGHVAPGFEVRLVDEHDEEVPVGEVGEVVVRAHEPFTTMVEYHADPEATSRALRNMWLHSGDLMRRDADGHFMFVDRLSDSIRRRGENISSFEVEREVYAHEGVMECAAVAVPSKHTEDDLAVVVVPRVDSDLTEQSLRAFLADRMPRFMVPDAIVLRREMPKTPTGKIQKHRLRADLGSSPPAGTTTQEGTG